MIVFLGLLIDLLLVSVLLGPAHLTLDLKAHEEEHCREFNIPESNWIYNYTENSFSICSKAVGGIAEGCAISDGKICTIVLPKSLGDENGSKRN